jgi:cellulose biosynthesis protein BcsQ/4-amino-4-deoxy-L-arabinose transferase-like glycosyltransferase
VRTIAIANHKGGTAKTTTTVNLAAALGELGHRVLVIDMDPQGSMSAWLGVRDTEFGVIDAIRGRQFRAKHVYETSAPGVQLVPASPGLVVSDRSEETDIALGFMQALEGLPPLWDFVLVDCPPSLGYLSIAPLTVCQEVLVPVETHVLAMAGLTSLLATIARTQGRLNPGLRIAGVLACRANRTSHSRKVVERLARRFPASFLQTQIRENVRLAEAPSFRLPITLYAPDSSGAEDYRALAVELAGPEQVRPAPPPAVAAAPIPAVAQAQPAPTLWSRLVARIVRGRGRADVISWLVPIGILALAAFVRLWQIDAVGFNTDEAVYTGQAAALVNAPDLTPFFPVFRAHPLLFQFTLAGVFSVTGVSDVAARIVSAAIGVLTVFIVFRLGRLLYTRTVGLIAALLMAVMPYHVVVTRQVLLDGPMTLFATLALYTVAKYAITGGRAWLYASGAAIGLTFLSKETGGILLGAIYAFFALTPKIAVRLRDLLLSLITFVAVIAAFPLALILAGTGGGTTAQQYLVWQLFRRPNHDAAFYLLTVPDAIGPLVLLAGITGLWLLRLSLDWRERLLLAWVAVTVAFFELWPVKGFQYLLPAAPPLAILGARGVVALARSNGPDMDDRLRRRLAQLLDRFEIVGRVVTSSAQPRRRIGAALARVGPRARVWTLAAIVALSLFATTWPRIEASNSPAVLAGTGGILGGRETGTWIRDNTPAGARLMTIGPSMANIVQFYGHRKAYGLSVSPNPLKRNPSYDPIVNPDLQIRTNELQYVVWDTYSASRSAYFEAKLLDYVHRYHGRAVHTELLPSADGSAGSPAIIVYEVRP